MFQCSQSRGGTWMDGKKRQPDDGNEGNSSREKRQRSLRSLMLEAVKMDAVQTILEPLVRKIVKEELEVALRKHLTSMTQQVHPYASRSLELRFTNKLSLPIFTGTRLEAEECSPIRLALADTVSGQVVNYSPESMAKVEIVVLEGDFGGDELEDWTMEAFSNNIVREREGKRPLLTGNAFLNLSEGTGVVGDLVFTDNSSWTRSRKFRLGARIIDNNCDGIKVKEAKTGPFVVKDHRGELYKKHYPPSLIDEVWRLEKIGKDGAFHKRLRSENINTVKDFLTLLCIDTPRLRNVNSNAPSSFNIGKRFYGWVHPYRIYGWAYLFCQCGRLMWQYHSCISRERFGLATFHISDSNSIIHECPCICKPSLVLCSPGLFNALFSHKANSIWAQT